MNDGLRFYGRLDYILYDEDGNIKDCGYVKNNVQDLLLTGVIDALDTGTFPTAQPGWMAIGTGDAAGSASSNLMSKVSNEALTSQTQPTSVSLANVATFTGVNATIQEAGLFNVAACTSGMLLYNHALNVVMTSADSLQITWTLSVASA